MIINGESVQTTGIFGITEPEPTVGLFVLSSEHLPQSGSITIRIKNIGSTSTNRQVIIDNVSWTSAGIEEISTKLYDVRFNENESYIDNTSIIANDLLAEPSDPIKEGYTFLGWFDEEENLFDFDTPITRHMTLTAKFEVEIYTLTFDSNGGTPVAPITGDYATDVVAPTSPTREGYTFTGWSPVLPETMPAGNQTYTAAWIANDYTITFDVDGGSVLESLTQAYDSELVLPVPAKDGFNFVGWFTDVDKTTPFEATTMPLGNTTLYALWQDASLTSIVTFEVNGGSEITPVVVNNGEAVVKPVDPTKEGYTFIGWYTDVALQVAYDFETLISTDITLYAKWVHNVYSISFDPNGGSGLVQVKSAVHGFALVEEERPINPTKDGFSFVGWFDTNSTSGGNEWTNETILNSVKTYYARWATNSKYATIDTSGSFSNGISDGIIPSARLIITNDGDANIIVSFFKNNSSTTTIFNNSGGEIRLYAGSSNGGQLNIDAGDKYVITKITITTSTNAGYKINNGTTITANSATTLTNDQIVMIKNVGTGQVQIRDIQIEYSSK